MNAPRILIAATAAAALASTGVASAADAPVVSKQHTITGRSPVTVPGTGLKRGEKIPAGARLIYRTVTVDSGQRAHLTMQAPAGKKLQGLALGGKVGGKARSTPRATTSGRRASG